MNKFTPIFLLCTTATASLAWINATPQPLGADEGQTVRTAQADRTPDLPFVAAPPQSTVQTPYESSNSTSDMRPIALHGVVRPGMKADLPASVPGVIKTIHVKEGDRITKGMPLVTMEDAVPRARLAAADVETQLMGGLQRAQVEMKMAEDRLSRIRQLKANGPAATFELTDAEMSRDQAQAMIQQQKDALTAAEAAKKLAAAQLEQYTVLAPFDGVVTEIHQKAGAVDPSIVIISVANFDTLEVEMHAPVALLGKVRAGGQVTLKAAAPISARIPANVLSASPIIDSASDTFRCLLQINNAQHRLPAGFRVIIAE